MTARQRSTSDREVLATVQKVLTVVFLLFVFLLGVKGLGDGFKLLGRDFLQAFFTATENPFTALMVGILATTIVQSSSVTTSMVVGLVAAPENPLPIANAIPMIMGANIGTTVTNTAVALAHMARRDEFRRAFAVATCHDFFNFMTVAILLPLELMTGYLRSTATALASLLSGTGGYKFDSPLKTGLKVSFQPVIDLSETLFEGQQAQGVLIILTSGVLIVGALFLLVKVMRTAMQSQVETYVTQFLGRSAVLSILFGAIVTVMVQSSSITTALLVPLAGAGVVTLAQAFPLTLGANIGTTVTALLASLAAAGENAEAGVIIALVHLVFNVTGIVMIYPIAAIRNIPLAGARWFAEIAVKSRKWALVYVLVLFYGVPAFFAFLDRYL